MRIAGIRIGSAQVANRGATGHVLGNATGAERNIGGGSIAEVIVPVMTCSNVKPAASVVRTRML